MLEVLTLKPGSRILGVSCGSGKQRIAIYDHLETKCEVIGGDGLEELLKHTSGSESKALKARIENMETAYKSSLHMYPPSPLIIDALPAGMTLRKLPVSRLNVLSLDWSIGHK